MSFVNRIRLPIKITRPQLQAEREIFRKANGEIKVFSVIIRKQYEGETDLLPEKLHDRLMIALNHDDVRIEGERYIGNVVQDGDYTISWVEFLDYPIAKATFKVFATPFDASNTNCGTCEQTIQVVANDDDLGNVNEGDTLDVNVLQNDDVCCEPVAITFITTNSVYVQSITVTPQNTLEIVLKTNLFTQNNVTLARYRIQCENGQYDEAGIYANVIGTAGDACLSPTDLEVVNVEGDVAQLDWNNAGLNAYEWKLYAQPDLVTPVQSGSVLVSNITLSGLELGIGYVFMVRTICAEDQFSNFAQIEFETNPPAGNDTCGTYLVCFNDPERPSTTQAVIQYLNCNGNFALINLDNFDCVSICALQDSPGDPVNIHANLPEVTINYIGLC